MTKHPKSLTICSVFHGRMGCDLFKEEDCFEADGTVTQIVYSGIIAEKDFYRSTYEYHCAPGKVMRMIRKLEKALQDECEEGEDVLYLTMLASIQYADGTVSRYKTADVFKGEALNDLAIELMEEIMEETEPEVLGQYVLVYGEDRLNLN